MNRGVPSRRRGIGERGPDVSVPPQAGLIAAHHPEQEPLHLITDLIVGPDLK